MLHDASVVIPIRNLSKGAAAVVYARLAQDRERRLSDDHRRALPPETVAQLVSGLIDPSRPPRLRFLKSDGSDFDLLEITLHMLGNWLDASRPPVPLTVGETPPAPARTLCAQMHAIARGPADDDDLRALAGALAAGLEQRLDRQLGDAERAVYLTIDALAGSPRNLPARVCTVCWRVFEAPRARYCPACRRNPLRASGDGALRDIDRRRPVVRVTVAGGAVVAYRSRPRRGTLAKTRYERICIACGAIFTCEDGRTRYCPEDATPAARSRRSRARARVRASGNSRNSH